jgi:pimeloyl-ACP methyl ester carboxylesterase
MFKHLASLAATAILILLVALSIVRPIQAQTAPVKNIVLVHGAWADASGWKGVYDILVTDGFKVTSVQEPETSFKDDVAATKRILALQDGPCILVAHSYGGAVITEAGTDPSVVGLVYIAAHMPDVGEKESEDGKRFPSDLTKSGAIKKTRAVPRILRGRRSCRPSRIHVAVAGAQLRGQLLSDYHYCRVAYEAKLDVGARSRPNHQSRPREVVCHASQQPQGGSSRCQSLCLHIPPKGSCRLDRGSGAKLSTVKLEALCSMCRIKTRTQESKIATSHKASRSGEHDCS